MADSVSIASRTCAVIVTYFPDSGLVERARLISNQVGAVIVVDNGSGTDHDNSLLSLTQIPNLALVRNDDNLGLGAALNQGVHWARDHDFEWVLLFDQDTTPFESMVTELGKIQRELDQEATITFLGCNFLDVNSGKTLLDPSRFPNQSWVNSNTMTTSGTLIPLSALDALGPFRSDLFVDLVDMEYSLRARSQGYRVVTSVPPLMLHTVGAKRKCRFLWQTVWPGHHSPLRRYYMARNLVLLVREYGANHPKWAVTEVLALAKSLILVLFYEDSKLSKLMFTGRGIIAGLRRSTGCGPKEAPTVGVVEDAPRLSSASPSLRE